MCGIFGYIGHRKDAAEIVLEGLKTLEYRGYDSWGIALLESKTDRAKINVRKKVGKIADAKISDLPAGHFAFGHTRWATHGGVTEINAHPHLDCTSQFALIHNGIIENYDEIKKELEKKGHLFISETDTEVAVHLIEDNYKRLITVYQDRQTAFRESVRMAFKRFAGLSAIIVMDSKTNTFVAVKNGSPLVIGKGKDENLLASDAHALFPYTRQVYFMEDDELVMIGREAISVYSLDTGRSKTVQFAVLNWKSSNVQKGRFPHFMLKEIFDQPQVLQEIIHHAGGQVETLHKLIKHSYGTYLVGCGTAAYACLAGTYLFSKIAKRHVNFSVGSEFGYLVDFLTDKSLVIALSQSGETIDVIEAVKKAKEKKSKIGSLVNVEGSTLYRISDTPLLLGAGVEKAVVSTKAFTAKLAYLILVAYSLAENPAEGKKALLTSYKAVNKVLEEANLEIIRKLAKELIKKDHIYIIGRGLSFPVTLETALKIKEASYLHAEGFAAGELKHGAIALVENNTPCIVFLPNDETYGASLAGAMEMKARGGKIIGISYKPHEIFDEFLSFDDCGAASIIPAAVIGQLLGYYLAIARGIDPDKPRNLAKSVTVK